jgi:prepilin-type N-terminal cleavage/methylation domain-containing protein/prepilin-type processing-associated H-X9-DG protein
MTSTSSHGFTLIELLVVVAIIAVLASLAMASMSVVRAAGRSTTCLSNLRQIGVGYQAFAQDNRGIGMPAYTGSRTWDNHLMDYAGTYGVMRCRDNTTAISAGGVSAGGVAAGPKSYALIAGISSKGATTWTDTAPFPSMLNGAQTVARLSWVGSWNSVNDAKALVKIPAPSQVAIVSELFDGVNGGVNRAYTYNLTGCYAYRDNLLPSAHRRRDNYLMLDGHVEALDKTIARGSAAIGTAPGGVWTIQSND